MLTGNPRILPEGELKEWLGMLIRDEVPEGLMLDYKSTLNIDTPKARKDFAQDMAAFANEMGGCLVIGVPEKSSGTGSTSIPASMDGIDMIPNFVSRLQDVAATQISPRLPDIEIVEVPTLPGKSVYVAWTPRSWIGPHAVDRRYFHRSGHRSHEMDPHVLRERILEHAEHQRSIANLLSSDDTRFVEESLGAELNLRIAALPLEPHRPGVELDRAMLTGINATASNIVGDDFEPGWFGAHTARSLASPFRSRYARIYFNGAVVLWCKVPPTSTALTPVSPGTDSAMKALHFPVGSILRSLASTWELVRVAARSDPGFPTAYRFDVQCHFQPDFLYVFSHDGFDEYRAHLESGHTARIAMDIQSVDRVKPQDVLKGAARIIGRYIGLADFDTRVHVQNDRVSIQEPAGSFTLWPI